MRWPWEKKQLASSQLSEFLTAGSSASGVKVTHETALQATTALACASVIAEGLSQVPLKLFKERSDGGSDAQRDHPLYPLLHRQPNEQQTAFEWREMCGLHLAFTGNHFSLIIRSRGAVVELLPFLPGSVTVQRNGYYITGYEVAIEGGDKISVSPADMLHLRGRSWNGYEGLDGVKLARDAIGLSMVTEEHGSRLFANGATPGGILSTDANLTKENREILKAAWDEEHRGARNAHKTTVLFGGLKWMSTNQQNDQAQFLETRAFQVEEVCRAFRVLPIMVGYSDKASTYASAEQMFLAHVTHTLQPWFTRVEQAYDSQLLTEAERREGYYTRHLSQGLLRGTHEARANFYTSLYNIGVLNPNEIRALEEMNPYDGGDDYRVPLNMESPNAPEDQNDEQ